MSGIQYIDKTPVKYTGTPTGYEEPWKSEYNAFSSPSPDINGITIGSASAKKCPTCGQDIYD